MPVIIETSLNFSQIGFLHGAAGLLLGVLFWLILIR